MSRNPQSGMSNGRYVQFRVTPRQSYTEADRTKARAADAIKTLDKDKK